MGHLETRWRTHIDRQNPFQRGAKIAARTIALGTSDDEQTPPKIAHVFFDVFHLGVRKLIRWNIIEDQQIVGGEFSKR
jgi:hypothetical protein